MRGLRLHGRELRRGPPREAEMGKLRPEARRLIQGHAAGQAFAGSGGRPGASCAVRSARGSRCERNCGDCGLGTQAGPVSMGLARGQGLFCSPCAGSPKSGSWGNITLLISRSMFTADGGGGEGPVGCRLRDRTAWVQASPTYRL